MTCNEKAAPNKWKAASILWQGYQDSNLNKQIQNLLCCHYTISLQRCRHGRTADKSITAAGAGGQLPNGRPLPGLHTVGPATGCGAGGCHAGGMTFKKGDQVKWNSHDGEAQGKVVRVAHEDGEVSGFQYRASQDDPRYIIEVEGGKQVAHTADALSKA